MEHIENFRTRIAYKGKYIFWRNAAIMMLGAWLVAMVFMVRAMKANLDTQAKFINPDEIAATMEVR